MPSLNLRGEIHEIECPRCGGEGTVREVRYWAESTEEWVIMNYEDDIPCPLCDGEGRIEDVPAYGEVIYDE